MNQPSKEPYQNLYYASSSNHKPPEKKPTNNRRHLKRLPTVIVLILIVVGALLIFSGHNKPAKKVEHDVAVVVKKVTTTTPPAPVQPAVDVTSMGQTINDIIAQNKGIDMSVNLIDLDNDQAEHYGVDETFQAASTAKIITAEYFLNQVEAGNQSLSETINGNSAEYEMQQMIVVSDDNAWAALNEKLGYDDLQDYADKTFGISDYQAYNNSLSSNDIALSLQMLWQNKLLNSDHTQLLLSYLKLANYRQYIVPAVPADDTIYHKIGLYQDYVNDAAIITHGNQAFVIVIFTDGDGTYNWPARATTMQEITKAALKAYFNE
jgi:beta-lactamase class A